MTTVNINNNDILEKVNSINLLSHLNDVEEFNNRNDLQELKTNLNIKDLLASNLSELKEKIGNVEEFTNDNDPKIKLLKDLFSNSSVAAQSKRGFVVKTSSQAAQEQAPPPVRAQGPLVTAPVTAQAPPPVIEEEQNLTTPIVVEDKVEKELTPKLTQEQRNEFERINAKLVNKIDLNNLSDISPSTGKNGLTIQWGNNPIWMGKIYTDERGVGKLGGYDVFMKDDGFSVVDRMPLNPAVTFSGENATIKKKEDGEYVLLEKDKRNNYGFEFEYKGTVGTLSSYFGIDEGKSGGKKKSKSKRTKKNGSLKKRK